jgi:hypothetical protein
MSELTCSLAAGAGFTFASRGAQPLKGLEGEWRLAALVENEQ